MIRVTKHAAEAMEARIIPFEWVERTLTFPDWTDTDPRHADRTRAFKAIPEFDGRVLRVVFRPDGADIVVITVHPDRSAKR
jgi:hypothetical protein